VKINDIERGVSMRWYNWTSERKKRWYI